MPGTRSWLTSLGCQPRAKESFTLVASSTGLPWSWLLRQGKKMLTYRRNTLIGLNCSMPITPSFSSSETAPREPCCWWELWTTWRESPYTMNCSTLPPVALSFFSHLWCFFSFRIPLSKDCTLVSEWRHCHSLLHTIASDYVWLSDWHRVVSHWHRHRHTRQSHTRTVSPTWHIEQKYCKRHY